MPAHGAYNADYNRLVHDLLAQGGDRAEALLAAVGGDERIGDLEITLLHRYGLRDGQYLVDVGCGSGRLTRRAARLPRLRYLGTDVVLELLQHARETSGRTDFRFARVDGLRIPEKPDTADQVCFFSVGTHLLPEEFVAYLLEGRRVLKPGGLILFSYLDLQSAPGRKIFADMVWGAKGGQPPPHLNTFTSVQDILTWAEMLRMRVVDILPGGFSITAPEAVQPLLSGPVVGMPSGQGLAVFRKPESDPE